MKLSKNSIALFNGRYGIHKISSKFFHSVQFPSSGHLPVLDSIIKNITPYLGIQPLKRTIVISVHHALPPSLALLRAQFKLGLDPKYTFVLDKHYSECKEVVEKIKAERVNYQPSSAQIGLGKFSFSFIHDVNHLWYRLSENLKNNETVENIIIMDHGGHALSFIPSEILEKYRVVGLEETMGGLINPSAQGLTFPVIEVASCAAKKIFESPLIAEAVVTKLTPLIPIKDDNLTCGVVGYGSIGKAVANKLLSMGHKVIVYDQDPYQLKGAKNIIIANELTALIAHADYIFGCTGRDIAAPSIDHLRLSLRNKTLISCSSEDKEYLSLLNLVQRKENGKVATKPLNEVVYRTDMGGTIRILRGGFPINFDDSGESVPANDIQLTRALVLGGALQAVSFFQKPLINAGGNYKLDAELQKFIVREWLKYQPPGRFSQKIIDQFLHDKEWVAENSGGIEEPCDILGDENLSAVRPRMN